LYTLDKFGGVFVLGAAREIEEDPVPQFGGSPYFFPFLYAEDIEIFGRDETGYEEEETGFERLPIELVTIPAGSFMMGNSGSARDTQYGSSDEYPRHQVTFNYDFQMGKYEVTNAQYAEVLDWANGRGYLRNAHGEPYSGGNVHHSHRRLFQISHSDCDVNYSGGQFYVETRNSEAQHNHPVNDVSWYAAVAFCNWASERDFLPVCYDLNNWSLTNPNSGGYRLPSESEWEYACRGSFSNLNRYAPFSFGDDPSLHLDSCSDYSQIFDHYVVWCGNDDGWTEEVGSKLPNDYGLHNMHGNVSEWCQDWWHWDYNGAPTNGSSWETPLPLDEFRVIRGGLTYFAEFCRSANRSKRHPAANAYAGIGIRVARTP
jgi:formylglycine-generating enzyme required for sulfatase activity